MYLHFLHNLCIHEKGDHFVCYNAQQIDTVYVFLSSAVSILSIRTFFRAKPSSQIMCGPDRLKSTAIVAIETSSENPGDVNTGHSQVDTAEK